MASIADIWLKRKATNSDISFDALILLTLILSETSILSKYSIYNIQALF